MIDSSQPPTTPRAKLRLKDHIIIALAFVALIWTVKVIESLTSMSFSRFGVLPRDIDGLWGLAAMPFLHRDYSHLAANSVPSFVLILCTFQFYRGVALRVVVGASVLDAAMVWVFARPAYHIGASGLIYALAAFLFLSGVFRRDRKSIAVALIVAFLYGSMVWGVLPVYADVSWEGHLFGVVSGGIFAYRYRNRDRPRAPDPDAFEQGFDADDLPWDLAEEPEKPVRGF